MPWLLLILPLLAAVSNQLFLRKTGIAHLVSTASAAATFIIAVVCLGKDESHAFSWATVGDFNINIGITLDRLSTGMMIVVTGVGLLVHVFSLAYMKDDDAKARYFTGLALFMFSMTGIVLASNFIMTFIFWELVGLSSYLLIGHWYHKDSAADAAKKAFLTNRIGDFGFMIGILMLWKITGSLVFSEMAIPPDVSAGVLGAALLCVFCWCCRKIRAAPPPRLAAGCDGEAPLPFPRSSTPQPWSLRVYTCSSACNSHWGRIRSKASPEPPSPGSAGSPR